MMTLGFFLCKLWKHTVFSAEKAVNRPRPIQGHIPLLAGAFGKNSLKIATKHADIIHCLNDSNPEKIQIQKRRIREGCKKTGRNLADIRIAGYYPLWLNPTPQEIEERASQLVRYGHMSPQQAAEYLKQVPSTLETHIETIQDMLANDVKILIFQGSLDKLRIFGDHVLPKLK